MPRPRKNRLIKYKHTRKGRVPTYNEAALNQILNQIGQGNSNPGLGLNLQNTTKYNAGSILAQFFNTQSLTIALANTLRVKSIWDFGLTVRNAITAAALANNEELHFGKFTLAYHIYDDKPFAIVPFKCTMENGEVITATDASGDPVEAIKTAIGESTHLSILRTDPLFPTYEPGDAYYHLYLNVNLTKDAEEIIKDYYVKEMNEADPAYLEGFQGFCLIGVPEQSVSIDVYSDIRTAVGNRVRRIPGI